MDKTTHPNRQLYKNGTLDTVCSTFLHLTARGNGAIRYDLRKHAEGVCGLSIQVAMALGLPSHIVEEIGQSGYYHDIGKQQVPSKLLNKLDKLTDAEFAKMKQHTQLGCRMLEKRNFPKTVVLAALEYHVRCDGSGYMGLTGENISLAGRIVAVADVYDACMTRCAPTAPTARHGCTRASYTI